MSGAVPVLAAGVDHRSAPLATLERVRAAAGDGLVIPPAACRAAGAVLLATCHRVELYLEEPGDADPAGLFRRLLGLPPDVVPTAVRRGADAARHLLRVASGLESAVLGEDQVLGQVRRAYREACARRQPGPLLHRLFHAAFRAGKRARCETPIQAGARSLAGCAAAFAGRAAGGLTGKTVLVLGAGDMGRLAAGRLANRGAGRILVANRTLARARELAGAVGGVAIPWPWRATALGAADAVVVATAAPEPVLTAGELAGAVRHRTRLLVVVDLSLPRNIEVPRPLPAGLVAMDIAGLGRSLERDRRRRAGAVRLVEGIVEQELAAWLDWVRSRRRPAGTARQDRAAG